MIHNTKIRKGMGRDQAGLVSFFVVIIVMAILTLIVIAYAQITRREQRQALDRQLNSQAFFVAESGANDAVDKLKEADPSSTLRNTDFTKCSGEESFERAAGLTPQLSTDSNISYSCLLVDATPQQLSYDNIAVGSSQVIPIYPKSGQSLAAIRLNWQNVVKGHSSVKTGCPSKAKVNQADTELFFDSTPENCEHPVLRVELVPFSGSRTRDDLTQNRAIFFVQPVSDDEADANGVEPTYQYAFGVGAGVGNQGKVVPASCTLTKKRGGLSWCGVAFNLPSFVGYVRITSLYNASSLRMTGTNAAGQPVEFTGAQAEIDVTGKAGDVLKRIRVYRSLGTSTGTPLPDYALQSTKTQCKRFNVDGTGPDVVVSGAGDLATTVCDPTE